MDFNNWNKERQKLKDEILQELRSQRDRKSQVVLRGLVKFNPQIVKNEFIRLGPYRFGTSFLSIPSMGLSNVPSSKEFPFYVDTLVEWDVQRGTVDGFYLGLYPVMQAHVTLDSHTIGWVAVGQAAAYKPASSVNRWAYSYDTSRPNYLEGTT